MAYEPTVWKTGDIVTSEKLNKIENQLAQLVNAGIVWSVEGTPQEVLDIARPNIIAVEISEGQYMAAWKIADTNILAEGQVVTFTMTTDGEDQSQNYTVQKQDSVYLAGELIVGAEDFSGTVYSVLDPGVYNLAISGNGTSPTAAIQSAIQNAASEYGAFDYMKITIGTASEEQPSDTSRVFVFQVYSQSQ